MIGGGIESSDYQVHLPNLLPLSHKIYAVDITNDAEIKWSIGCTHNVAEMIQREMSRKVNSR